MVVPAQMMRHFDMRLKIPPIRTTALRTNRMCGSFMQPSRAQSIAQCVSGEFPSRVLAKLTVHFGLVWTADRDIDPEWLGEFLGTKCPIVCHVR